MFGIKSVCFVTCFTVFILIIVSCFAQEMIAKGRWLVQNAFKCPNADDYKFGIALKRKKMNRTHDGFDAKVDLPEDITETNMGVYVESCIKVDGGCKLIQVVTDTSLCNFMVKYGADNVKKILESAGLEGGCPIPSGHHEVHNYVFDYEELPEDGMLGDFQCTIYLTQEEERIGCIMLDVTFEPRELYAPEFGWK